MDSATFHALLTEHIPYRLESIHLLRFICDLLSTKAPERPATLAVDNGAVLIRGNFRVFTNPLFEIGTMYCRVLLEFLGLKEDNKTGKLIAATARRDSDLKIEDFGNLRPLTPDDLNDVPLGKLDECQRACVTTIQVAHRAIAHLVLGGGPGEHLKEVRLCADIVPWLIEKHLYEPLDFRMPPSQVKQALRAGMDLTN